ncbi:MAG TPA: TetR/AcrR family transcriptional regulator [Acidimicrobiales bacterium]|nr:TetR/AcrR family transcriptional regulator [Acidimicrobiales bacterium]
MSVSHKESSRRAQRDWTASAILAAAEGLMAHGATPSVSDAAEAAGVSRATAYRYFPTQGALLYGLVRRAIAGSATRSIEAPPNDVSARASEVARSLAGDVRDHEHQFRALLWQMLGNWLAGRRGEVTEELPRGGRIAPIEAAMEPLRDRFAEDEVLRLVQALSMLIGIEGWVVLRDMWHLDDAAAIETLDAAVRWLVAGFLSSAEPLAATPPGRKRKAPAKAAPRGEA